jgi:ubiquinone/menaquinone biosynthesis C-methylase UbiE
MNQDQVTPQRIMQFAWGYVPPLAIEAAIRNRIFDVLDSGPKTVQEVHKESGSSVRGLTAIMNVLAGLELLAKDGQGRFSLTPESAAFLVSTKPGFFGGLIRHTSEDLIPKFLDLNEIVATGKPIRSVNENDTGTAFFQQLVADIYPMSYAPAQALAKHLDLNKARKPARVLDLAAGSGVWGIALAQSSDRVSVSAVDWPGVLPITRNFAERFGLADRFSFIEGDIGEVDFGTNYSVATLGHILHSEGEERSRSLLAKIFNALEPGGTIAIAEFLVNADRTGPLMGLIFAVNMLVNTDKGDTYSFEEISKWLRDAGFTNPRTLDAPGPSPLILATKP